MTNIKRKTESPHAQKALWGAAGIAVLLAAWKAASLLVSQDLLLPPPERVLLRLAALCVSPRFAAAFLGTLLRLVSALAVSLPLGIIAGLASGISVRAERFLRPFFSLIASTPVMSVILIAFLWFGPEKTPPFAAFLMIFPIITSGVLEGVKALDPKLKELFAVYRIRGVESLRHLYLPQVAPFVAAGCRASLSMCWKVVVAAEVLVQPLPALGTEMQRAKAALDTTELFAWTAAAITASAASQAVFRVFKKG